MITFTLVHKTTTDQEFTEFCKSLSYSNSGVNAYEVISERDVPENINRVEFPSSDSVIHIHIPDDCIVLGGSWDRYIMYAIEHGLPKHGVGKDYRPNWNNYVQAKMGLQTRRSPEGMFPDLKVTLATE